MNVGADQNNCARMAPYVYVCDWTVRGLQLLIARNGATAAQVSTEGSDLNQSLM